MTPAAAACARCLHIIRAGGTPSIIDALPTRERALLQDDLRRYPSQFRTRTLYAGLRALPLGVLDEWLAAADEAPPTCGGLFRLVALHERRRDRASYLRKAAAMRGVDAHDLVGPANPP